MKDGGGAGPGAVLCVGRVYCDLVFTGVPRLPSPGTEVFAGGLALSAGGGAAITAAWLVHGGRPACLAAHLPREPFEAVVRRDLDAAGVDLRFCAPAEAGSDPQLTVAIVGGADRAFLTRADGAPVPPLEAGPLRAAGIRHVHVGELATLRARPDLIALARSLGATLSADCAWDDGVDADVAPLIAVLDVFLPNEAEAARLRALGVAPAPLTVVKRGAGGAEARDGRGTVRAGTDPVTAVDPTGAGDAFDAGFLHLWLDGAPLDAALRAGNACGARAVRGAGGLPRGAGAVRTEAGG